MPFEDRPGLNKPKDQSDYENLIKWIRTEESKWKEDGLGPPLTPWQQERMTLSVLDTLPESKKNRALKKIRKTMKKLQAQIEEFEAL